MTRSVQSILIEDQGWAVSRAFAKVVALSLYHVV